MDVSKWYLVAYNITGGSAVYMDIVHDVYLKLQGKTGYNDSYIYRAILNRWIDEKRMQNKSFTPTETVAYMDEIIDPIESLNLFEQEILNAMNEGYKPKEIAQICKTSNRVIWGIIRGIKKKM